MKFSYLISVLGLSVLAQISPIAQAEVVVHGTRVVYSSTARETTVQLSNSGPTPSLVQLWVDEGDPKSTPEDSKAPFVITPPLSRVDSEKSQSFRIMALPSTAKLSQSQESLFWLNVLDIPAKPVNEQAAEDENNYLQLAIRSRIKMFYRPVSIQKQHDGAPKKLQWVKQGTKVQIKNPTPFFITIKTIYQRNNKDSSDFLPHGLMLSPNSEQTIELNSEVSKDLVFVTINDYGANVENNINF